jgi:EAL domain-containing protein (putative c-di-GMP-specific phosphodiesterase class I)
MRTFSRLRDMGVGIAVDDFGVGYSNLIYLRDLPLTELKIDQTFVRNVDSRPENAMIVRAVSGLAREFGLNVVAEGVESHAEHEAILKLGCDLGQGFHYNVPVEGDKFEWLIQNHERLPVPQ